MHWNPVRELSLENIFLSWHTLTRAYSLARAEILLAVATIFREFNMELYKTTNDDVRIVRDMFNGHPRKGSHGVRVIIKEWNGHPRAGENTGA